jgi:anti-sigma factor RsiW
MGHLGSRASALLDGQLSPEETERAWEHVQACHACRDLVEREGWVKTRLAGLSFDVAAPSTPVGLKGLLVFGVAPADAPTIDRRAPATINRTEAPQTPPATDRGPSVLVRSASARPQP